MADSRCLWGSGEKKRWDQLYTLGNQGSLRHWKGTLEVLSTIGESKRALLTCFFGHGGTFELENLEAFIVFFKLLGTVAQPATAFI